MKSLLLSALAVLCGAVSLSAQITVFPDVAVGPVKRMNAVNNGPRINNAEQVYTGTTGYFKAANVGYSRNHDAAGAGAYGEHVVDISIIFPDFSKNPNKPESYDFTLTDRYVKSIQDAGVEVFYRLGQAIENQPLKKYNIYPPKDNKKWAVIAEHIIRHYNEGWADGFHYNIKYWEIWNEPNLEWDNDKWKTDPRCWAGSPEQFYDFYEVAAKHLHACFPDLAIGGPAMSGTDPGMRTVPVWYERLLSEMQRRGVPIDFFAWHIYESDPTVYVDYSNQVRALLDKYGYTGAESFLNEWNYIKSWTDDYPYSMKAMVSPKAGAFVCAAMQEGQNCPTDMMMYYDWCPSSNFNGLFDNRTSAPLWSYWALYSWGKLKTLGTQVKAESSYPSDVRVTAARDSEGRLGILVSRYVLDDNITAPMDVTVRLASGSFDGKVRCHITDQFNMYTEYPVALQPDGTLLLSLQPDSFVFVEF
ncbi:MAG: hypothetical protein MJY55_00795 [Bacteroidales bacterium]|nr:hypothetical protein [Bacteroidales bacterium]